MTTIDITTPLGALVTAHPTLARELERLGLRYCCGDDASLASACEAAGIDARQLAARLEAAEAAEHDEAWRSLDPIGLVDHLVATHHAFLRSELPRLSSLGWKVVNEHGTKYPDLFVTVDLYEELRLDLGPHLVKEERVLFPLVRELARATHKPAFQFGSIHTPVSVMLEEHDRTRQLFTWLRESTGEYRAPEDGCPSVHAFYAGLEALEADTVLHIHKENDVLFPAVVALERDLPA